MTVRLLLPPFGYIDRDVDDDSHVVVLPMELASSYVDLHFKVTGERHNDVPVARLIQVSVSA